MVIFNSNSGNSRRWEEVRRGNSAWGAVIRISRKKRRLSPSQVCGWLCLLPQTGLLINSWVWMITSVALKGKLQEFCPPQPPQRVMYLKSRATERRKNPSNQYFVPKMSAVAGTGQPKPRARSFSQVSPWVTGVQGLGHPLLLFQVH